MAYTKNVWTDQQVERPRTYTVTENQDNTITLQDAFGVATDLGTPVNATNMNHIEEGIEQCYTDLVQRKSTTSATGNSTIPVYIDATGKVQECSRSIPNTAELLQQIYPVGAIYIGMTSSCPISALFGTWELISGGLTLQQANITYPVGTEIPAGLPNIKGTFPTIEGASRCYNLNNFGDAIYRYKSNNSSDVDNSNGDADDTAALDASRVSSVYRDVDTVQPPALAVNIWRRVA